MVNLNDVFFFTMRRMWTRKIARCSLMLTIFLNFFRWQNEIILFSYSTDKYLCLESFNVTIFNSLTSLNREKKHLTKRNQFPSIWIVYNQKSTLFPIYIHKTLPFSYKQQRLHLDRKMYVLFSSISMKNGIST